jgi:uncharacterized membrane protein YeaQ/YmgE (transglycosylase-associated protein family)
MLSLLWTILIGLVVGGLARFVIPGKEPYGCIFSIVLGIGGAVLFTYLGRFLGLYAEGDTAGFFGAFAGAVILLLVYKMIFGKRI